MRVRLLKPVNGCPAGAVVWYTDKTASELLAKGLAEKPAPDPVVIKPAQSIVTKDNS